MKWRSDDELIYGDIITSIAIWNKDLIGEKHVPMDLLYWLFRILVTLIVYFMTAGMFYRIRFLIDRDDWWLTLAEVLVGFKDSMIINPQTDRIFQSAMSVVIVDAYVNSVSVVLLPLHGCWGNTTHLDNISDGVSTAFEYVYNHISLCWLVYLFSHKKELSGRQKQQSKSSWFLSGSSWHTKRKWFLAMEYPAVFITWKPRLVYCMYSTAMEHCYSYRESITRYYWSDWWPIYSVSWVSLDYQITGIELTLFKVYSCLRGALYQISSGLISSILG